MGTQNMVSRIKGNTVSRKVLPQSWLIWVINQVSKG